MRLVALMLIAALLAGCAGGMPPAPGRDALRQSFQQVAARVEPVAERECQARKPGLNCDFIIVMDPRPRAPANAFQFVDEDTGRPVLVLTLGLLAQTRNGSEIAFVLSHEAAHHILGHIDRTRAEAIAGAEAMGTIAAAAGRSSRDQRLAAELGAALGARRYAKDFELEADRLGTRIAWQAGYDPRLGAQFFDRIPDPGDRFLGTHPPNAARKQTVDRVMDQLAGS